MREIKAECGWAVVCAEECAIHPLSDYSPTPQARLWGGYDVRCLALNTDAAHRHGALAGVELAHTGAGTPNFYSRLRPISPSPQAGVANLPSQTRGMDKADIREFRRWHRDAALRAREADADIVYVYGGSMRATLRPS